MIRTNVIAIGGDTFKQELRAAAGRIRNQAAVCKAGAQAVQTKLVEHFDRLNGSPNKEGWKKSNFWADIAESTVLLTDGNAAVVQINDPNFNLKFYGGTVTPKTAKLLSIPLQEQYKGVRPSFFPDDKFFFLPVKTMGGSSIGILAEHIGDNKIRAAYLLNKYTKHAPQPDALPPMEELRVIAVDAMKRYIERGS